MQTLEAILSLLVLVSLSIFLFIPAEAKIDNSLYLYSLQGDVENVMHLKGGLENISQGNEIAMKIYAETGLCMEFSETDITSYPVAKGKYAQISVPQLKELNLEANGSEVDAGALNLTGFKPNSFSFGLCNN